MLRCAALRGPIACVDLETTGGNAPRDRIIEVGIVLMDDGEVVDEWSSLVAPGTRIPYGIEQFTGISNAMVADAPSFAELAHELRERLAGRLFVAHNVRFDYGFVRNEFRRLGERFDAPVLCTVRLSRALTGTAERHNLDTLLARYAIDCSARHRALGDARVLPKLLQAFEARVGADALAVAVVAARHEVRLPPQLAPSIADDWPEGPGVYVFRGEGGALLYVGKSTRVRERVLAHFAADHRSAREQALSRLVHSVECISTAGELGALLLESRLVKQCAPTRNRRLKTAPLPVCLRIDDAQLAASAKYDTACGIQVRYEVLAGGALGTDTEAYGPFRSERDARKALTTIARDSRLCLKVLGMESGEGSCFGHQVGRCRGVCVGLETPALHGARVRLALASLRLRPWPFDGAVTIRERSAGGVTAYHVCDRWQHLATLTDSDECLDAGEENLTDTFDATPGGFDVDAYRILRKHLPQVAPQDLLPWPPARRRQVAG